MLPANCVGMSNRLHLLLCAVPALFAAACAVESPPAGPSDSEPSAADETAADAKDGEQLGTTEQAVDYNPCACLDQSRMMSCGTGSTCTKYRATSSRDIYYCAQGSYSYSCTHYAPYLCRKAGYYASGLPCCGGSAYNAGQILCY